MFTEMTSQELMDANGGLPFILGVLAAAGIVVGTGVVVASTVAVVGKAAQWVADQF